MPIPIPTPTPSPIAVADDIYQIRLPLPFALNHVNCYALRGPEGWTLVDGGLNTSAAREGWTAALAALAIAPGDISQIVLTHFHPDHYGLTGWLQQWAAGEGRLPPVRMSAETQEMVRLVWQAGTARPAGFGAYFRQCGLAAAFADQVVDETEKTAQRTTPHPALVELFSAAESLEAGGRRWRLIDAPGHADGQTLLYDAADRLLISADHVLLKITPNIGRWREGSANPLGAYLASLAALRDLDVRLALPGHRGLITDWRGRLAELGVHHEQRLEETVAAVAGGAETVTAVARILFQFGAFSLHEVRFAVAETLAHLVLLEERGLLQRRVDDGVWRFGTLAAPADRGEHA